METTNIMITQVSKENFLEAFRTIIREEIKAEQLNELQGKLLSRAEACKIFQPKISTVTLDKWTSEGRIQSRRIGRRVFYKYAEVVEAAKTLKKYIK
jgi:hypothetical protein